MSKAEKRAFETFFASELRHLDESDFDFSADVELEEKERTVLDCISDEFLDLVVAGKVQLRSDEETQRENVKRELAGAGGALYRADDVSEEDALKLDAQERELIERKSKDDKGE